MTARTEVAVTIGALALLSALVAVEGRRRSELERRLPVGATELYRRLARSQSSVQLIDVRADLAGFEDAHLPGSIPMPGCDPSRAPEKARGRIVLTAPTVVVSASGAEPDLATCLARFGAARGLAGGMAAWSAANLPEDSGEYSPPSAKAGGGCL
jgi:rhodanese-related sulfurtransferase